MVDEIEIEMEEMNDFDIETDSDLGGTTDYNNLNNKPRINGVVLEGDKTSEDLEIYPYNDTEIKQDIADIQKEQATQDEEISDIKEVNTAQDELIAKLKGNMFNLTAEGTSINVQDSSDLPSTLEVSGGVRQEVREGTNLLDLNVTQNSKVTVNEDGTITINGTGGFSLNYKELTLKSNITYYQKWELISGSATSTNGEIFMTLDSSKYSAKDKFTSFSKTEDTVRSSLWINENAIFTNAVIKIWANTDQSDFEKAGATPSPDYPSDVKAVGDNVNLFDENAEKTNTYINETGKETIDNGNSYIKTLIQNNIKKHYIMSYKNNYNSTVRFSYYNNETFISGQLGNTNNAIFTVPDNCNKIDIRTNVKGLSNFYFEELKIEQGPVATSYSPYGMGSLEINKVNKNIFTKKNITEQRYISNNGDEVYLSNWSITDYTYIYGSKYISYQGLYDINSNVKNGFYNKNKELISLFQSKEGKNTVEVPENTYYVRFTFNQTANHEEDTLQIEIGEATTDYTPHESEVYNLPIQQPMLSGDTFVKEDGNWFEVHGWEKYVFTGEEEIAVNSIYPNTFNINLSNLNILPNSLSYSNMAIGIIYKPEVLNDTDNIIMTGEKTNLNRAIHRSSSFSELEAYKQYLKERYNAGKPAYIWYKLATPTKLHCTDEQKQVLEQLYNMDTYRPVTNIFTMQDLANLKLSYVADSKIYVDNEINAIKANLDTINQLLSTTATSALLLNNMQTDLESEVI